MAEGKKSFVLYSDQRGVFDKLSDEQAGILIKHIFGYVNDEKPKGDFITELAFESIKQQLKRDLVKYEVRADRSRANGKLGGRPKNPEKPKEPSGLNNNLDEPRKPDTVNVTVTVNDNEIKKERFESFWTKYPKKVNKVGCKKKWMKLEQPDIDKILSTIDTYISYKPFTDYNHPNPMTYLNQQRWNDELPESVMKPDKKDIDKLTANSALNVPKYMEHLLNTGWTREEIVKIATS